MSTELILLGTAAGPAPKRTRSAPAQVVVVDGASYVIDCGNGVARQLALAGVPLDSLHGVFLTHHHSDHNADYGNLFLLAWAANLEHRVPAYGPPPLTRMTEQFLAMNRFDIDTRIADEGLPPLDDLIAPTEVTEERVVHEDENVRVTATLVHHPPIATALAYRFDTADRSIVISGDTAPSRNLVRLAAGADVLVHEVMYLPAVDAMVAGFNGRTLRQHLLASHTDVDRVGALAQEAGVGKLVLSHFVPTDVDIPDETWRKHAAKGFDGEVVVGHDLMTV
ncbi:MBL fold metallo-hydrolase [Streptomyces sp. B-S-A8]|uniref:MBL fold metallo-hydrolase n=1 Tax=Streptomyces solicavernae TaxID=3043614 RepID=A0ABT6RUM4_9ACTN|nr:MBL fold metallo-hydrolase [Streptomyces sp. B-S-A8]MDI3388090.1 MBL fold metallo-hydrolase [Streptomyces sp. B-S-A8]